MCCMIPDSAVHIHHKEPVPTAELEVIQKKTVLFMDSLAETDLGNNNHNRNQIAIFCRGDARGYETRI